MSKKNKNRRTPATKPETKAKEEDKEPEPEPEPETETTPEVEIEVDEDEQGCPIIEQDGEITLVDEKPIPKKLFWGKESNCARTHYGKGQFLLYMSKLYKYRYDEHQKAKDPKFAREREIDRLRKRLEKLEAEEAATAK